MPRLRGKFITSLVLEGHQHVPGDTRTLDFLANHKDVVMTGRDEEGNLLFRVRNKSVLTVRPGEWITFVDGDIHNVEIEDDDTINRAYTLEDE